jgi:FkbM family methyltransferase
VNVIDKILNHPLLKEKPIVLIDIGASGGTHKIWKKLASKSICIAFDADTRELNFEEKESNIFKKLYVINAIVSDDDSKPKSFNLTNSPFCSSLLKPNINELEDYFYRDSFEVEKEIELKTITIDNAISNLNIKYIDWFKTDSQGTDLRIFKSISENTYNKISVAEFEPGIINAYQEEDMLFELLKFFKENNHYYCESCEIKGSPRIKKEYLNMVSKNSFMQKLLKHSLPQDAGWAEIRYLRKHQQLSDLRSYLVAYVFSMLLGQYGNAISISEKIEGNDNHILKREMRKYAESKIKKSIFSFYFFRVILNKLLNKL